MKLAQLDLSNCCHHLMFILKRLFSRFVPWNIHRLTFDIAQHWATYGAFTLPLAWITILHLPRSASVRSDGLLSRSLASMSNDQGSGFGFVSCVVCCVLRLRSHYSFCDIISYSYSTVLSRFCSFMMFHVSFGVRPSGCLASYLRG